MFFPMFFLIAFWVAWSSIWAPLGLRFGAFLNIFPNFFQMCAQGALQEGFLVDSGCPAASRMSLSHTPASVWRRLALWVPWSFFSTKRLPKGTFWHPF
jgi:hypothetical protein